VIDFRFASFPLETDHVGETTDTICTREIPIFEKNPPERQKTMKIKRQNNTAFYFTGFEMLMRIDAKLQKALQWVIKSKASFSNSPHTPGPS
jgi:hypothetical protein